MLGVYLHDSDLVLRTAFPILVNHLSEFWPQRRPALSQQPGTPITLAPGPGARDVVVTRPDGHHDVLVAGRASLAANGGTLLFTDDKSASTGCLSGGGPPRPATSYIAVNAPGSAITPENKSTSPARRSALASASLYQGLWTILAIAALVVLALEWLVYHRAG